MKLNIKFAKPLKFTKPRNIFLRNLLLKKWIKTWKLSKVKFFSFIQYEHFLKTNKKFFISNYRPVLSLFIKDYFKNSFIEIGKFLNYKKRRTLRKKKSILKKSILKKSTISFLNYKNYLKLNSNNKTLKNSFLSFKNYLKLFSIKNFNYKNNKHNNFKKNNNFKNNNNFKKNNNFKNENIINNFKKFSNKFSNKNKI